MDWYGLGHAMWLAEAEGLRLLFDPTLEPTHHGGVFEVRPRRTVNAEALRADFVLVSHRHGDHFDVPSLRRLAALDPESVVITPDELVAWAAGKVGFRTVHLVKSGQKVELDGVRIVTTPSVAELEWGAVVETRDAVAWNQVDSVPADAEHLRTFVSVAMAALGRPGGQRLDLALVAWQPMLEIAAVTCRATGFPFRRYDDLLRQIATLSPRTAVPSACGGRHVGVARWMDRHVYPVPEARFLKDLALVTPVVRGLPSRVGGRYRIAGGAVDLDAAAGSHLVNVHRDGMGSVYDPLEVPPLEDPDRGRAPREQMRSTVERWIGETLAPALREAHPSMGVDGPLSFVVDVVWPDRRDAYTLRVDAELARVERGFDPDWDVLDRVAGSLFFEVVEGRYHWGDVLLGGMLRAVSRAYHASEDGIARARVGPTFLYYGLPYDEAVRRAVVWEVEQGDG